MRTYLIDSDGNELKIDLTRTTKHSSELVEFEFSTISDNEIVNTEKIYILENWQGITLVQQIIIVGRKWQDNISPPKC